jgi:hypothetical protein
MAGEFETRPYSNDGAQCRGWVFLMNCDFCLVIFAEQYRHHLVKLTELLR